jgi:hypothetical protein
MTIEVRKVVSHVGRRSLSSVNRIQVWVRFDPSFPASGMEGVQSLAGKLSVYTRNRGLRVAGRDDLDAMMMASNLILPRVSSFFRLRDQIKTNKFNTDRQQQRNNTDDLDPLPHPIILWTSLNILHHPIPRSRI